MYVQRILSLVFDVLIIPIFNAIMRKIMIDWVIAEYIKKQKKVDEWSEQ